MVKFIKAPITYLINKVIPLYKYKTLKTWTDRENERLITICKGSTCKINLSLLLICFLWCSRKQIYSHYRDFVSKGIIRENHYFNQSSNESLIKFHFIDNSDSKTAEEIKADIEKGIQVDKNSFIHKNDCYYYEPWNLAKRVAFHNYIGNKKQIPE